MSIPYHQSYSSKNTDARLSDMRLPSYKSLHLQRYHPYTTRPLLYGPTYTTEPVEDADFEADMLLAHADPNPVLFSLPMVLEDDCMDGLRTVVSQMGGRDNTRIPLGSVHLVIDFAFILRNYRCKSDAAVRNESTM